MSNFNLKRGVKAVYIYFVIKAPKKAVPLNCTVPESVGPLAVNIRLQLDAYMARYMGNIPFKLTIRYMRIGSIQVNATIEKPDTLEASQRFSEAFFALDDATFSIDGVPYNTSAIALNNTPIVTGGGTPEDVCRVFLLDRGQCPDNGVCTVVDGTPSCFPAQVDDGEKLVLGLAIGIPLFFLACLALVLCALLLYRRRMQKHADNSSSFTESTHGVNPFLSGHYVAGFFPGHMATRLHRRDFSPFHPPQWEEDSASTSRSSDSVYSENKQSHSFSWDFLYNGGYLRDDYHIKRPELRT